jgi:acylphosphatase
VPEIHILILDDNTDLFDEKDRLGILGLTAWIYSVELSKITPGMASGTRRYLVAGRVQGVGYRNFALRVARDLQLTGWVRNLPDGRVEALARGPLTKLNRFVSELRIGPPSAEVTSVEVADVPAGDKLEGFHIR